MKRYAALFALAGLLCAPSLTAGLPGGEGTTESTWVPVFEQGFCSRYDCASLPGYPGEYNDLISGIVPYQGALYLATSNWRYGGEIWRWDGDAAFEPVMTGGFGAATSFFIHSLREFNGDLYAGTWALLNQPMSIWRFDGTGWTPSTVNGLGDTYNIAATSLAVFEGFLYTGTCNLKDASELWRTADGVTWEAVVANEIDADAEGTDENGFAYRYNSDNTLMGVFRDRLHIFTEAARFRSEPDPQRGSQVWATGAYGAPPFNDWTQVNENGYGNPAGGVNENTIWRLAPELLVAGGFLYVGTSDYSAGGQLFRTDGEPSGEDQKYVWEWVNPAGFGDPDNTMVIPLIVFRDHLFVGTLNNITGAQLWAAPVESVGPEQTGVWKCLVARGFDRGEALSVIPCAHAAGDRLFFGAGKYPNFDPAQKASLWEYVFDGTLVDEDGDGYARGPFSDCDDANPSVNPFQTENCRNGLDDDCDGFVDSADSTCPDACGTLVSWERASRTRGTRGLPAIGFGLALVLLPLSLAAVRFRSRGGARRGPGGRSSSRTPCG